MESVHAKIPRKRGRAAQRARGQEAATELGPRGCGMNVGGETSHPQGRRVNRRRGEGERREQAARRANLNGKGNKLAKKQEPFRTTEAKEREEMVGGT